VLAIVVPLFRLSFLVLSNPTVDLASLALPTLFRGLGHCFHGTLVRAGRATTLASRATADAHKWLFQSDTLFQQRAGDVPAHFAIVLLDAIG
jgi:hypothetical protein